MTRMEPTFWAVEIEKVVRETVWVKSTDEEHAKIAALKRIHQEAEYEAWKYDAIAVTDVKPHVNAIREC